MANLKDVLAKARAITGKQRNDYTGPPPAPAGMQGGSSRAPGRLQIVPVTTDEVTDPGDKNTMTETSSTIRPQEEIERLVDSMNSQRNRLGGMNDMTLEAQRAKRLQDRMVEHFQPRANLQQLQASLDSIYGTKVAPTYDKGTDGMDLLAGLQDLQQKRMGNAKDMTNLQLKLGEMFMSGPKTVIGSVQQAPQVKQTKAVKPVVIPGGSSSMPKSQLPQGLEALNKDITPAVELVDAFHDIENDLRKSGLPSTDGLQKGMDIPGVGILDSISGVAGTYLPTALKTKGMQRDADMQQAKIKVTNIMAKARSGAVLNEEELRRLEKELGNINNNEGFVNFMKSFKTSLRSGIRRSLDARPQVFDYYKGTSTGQKLLKF